MSRKSTVVVRKFTYCEGTLTITQEPPNFIDRSVRKTEPGVISWILQITNGYVAGVRTSRLKFQRVATEGSTDRLTRTGTTRHRKVQLPPSLTCQNQATTRLWPSVDREAPHVVFHRKSRQRV